MSKRADKVLKSPVQYIGGKYWLFRRFYEYLPPNTKEIVSPFFGGGAIEINLAVRGVRVIGFDKFEPIVNFWNQFTQSPSKFVDDAVELMETETKDYFVKMHNGDYFDVPCKYTQGLLYFLLNRMAFRAITFNHYGLRTNYKRALNESTLERISAFDIQGFSVGVSDAFDVIDKYPNHFLYLDPPYPKLRQRLYGDSHEYHREFDHQRLFEKLKDRRNWVSSYNDIPFVRDLYKDFAMLPVKRWGDGGTKQKRELLIFSPDIVSDIYFIPTQLSLFEDAYAN